MVLYHSKYSYHLMQKILVTIIFICSFSLALSAQINNTQIAEKFPLMNPILSGAFKKPIKADPLLSEYIKPSKRELMYWPNFPLNAIQIEARKRDWERKNKQTIGEQIAGNIIKSSINTLIYGKKPVAAAPKF